MKELKRFLALFLCLTMLFTVVPVQALATEAETEEPVVTEPVVEEETPAPEATDAPAVEETDPPVMEETEAPAEEPTLPEQIEEPAPDADASVDSEADTQEVAETDVAKIGETGYATLADAVAAAVDGDTIYLLKDTEFSTAVTVQKKVTITAESDVTVTKTGTNEWLLIKAGGDVTLEGPVTVVGNTKYGALIEVASKGALTMNSGVTLKDNQTGESKVGAAVNIIDGTFTMNGGTIDNCDNTGSASKPGSTNGGSMGGGVRLSLTKTSTVNAAFVMNGGTIKNCSTKGNGGAVGVENLGNTKGCTASFTMNDGTITGCSQSASSANYAGGAAIYIYNKIYNSNLEGAVVTINGGKITGNTGAKYGTLGMYTGMSGNSYGGKYYILGGEISGNFVGSGTNNSPGSVYGNGVYLDRLINSTPVLTIGGNAIIDDEVFLKSSTGNYFEILDNFTGSVKVCSQAGGIGSDPVYGTLIAKQVSETGVSSTATKEIAGKITAVYLFLTESSSGDRYEHPVYDIVLGTNSDEYVLGKYPVYYTVTYTDGVDGEEIFADQSYTELEGNATPAFVGTPAREGYVFAGWEPEVSETVTGDVTYTAVWGDLPHGTINGVEFRGDNYGVSVELENVLAYEKVEVEVYCGEKLLTTVSLKNSEYLGIVQDYLTATVRTSGESSSWDATAWNPHDKIIPDSYKLYIDGQLMDTYQQTVDADIWAAQEGTAGGAINGVAFRGDGMGISVELEKVLAYAGVEVKVYSGEILLTTVTLREEACAEIRGTVLDYLTATVRTSGESSSWAATPWTPSDDVIPDKYELYVDGILVDTLEEAVDAETWVDQVGTAPPTPDKYGKNVTTSLVRIICDSDPGRHEPMTLKWQSQSTAVYPKNSAPVWNEELGTWTIGVKIDSITVYYIWMNYEKSHNDISHDPVIGEPLPEDTYHIITTLKWDEAKQLWVTMDEKPIDIHTTCKTKPTAPIFNQIDGYQIKVYGLVDGEELLYATYLSEDSVQIGEVQGSREEGFTVDVTVTLKDGDAFVTNWIAHRNPGAEYFYNWDKTPETVTFTLTYTGDLEGELHGHRHAANTNYDWIIGYNYKGDPLTFGSVAEAYIGQKLTVTYTDGVEDQEVFADQVYTALTGAATPAFEGEPTREGYDFAGWTPEVAETVTESTTYTATWIPKSPEQKNVTSELVAVICDSDPERHATVHGKWYPLGHCKTISDITWNEELGTWTVDVRIGSLYIMYVDQLEDANDGTIHELVEDITTVYATLKWDAEQMLWIPVEPIELHTTCQTAPTAPTHNQLDSYQIKVHGLVNGEEKDYTTSVPENGYTIGEVKGSREEGFTVDITVTLTEGDVYSANWVAKNNPEGKYFYDWDKTPATVTFTLKYNGSLTGTLHGERHASNTNYDWVLSTTGKIWGVIGEAYVKEQVTVTYTDGVENDEIFADETYTVFVGEETPAFQGTAKWEGDKYAFAGWNPEWTETVTGEVVYEAQWLEQEPVFVYAVTDGKAETAELIFSGRAPNGINLVEWLETNVELAGRKGYHIEKWYDLNNFGTKIAEDATVDVWNTVYVNYVDNLNFISGEINGYIPRADGEGLSVELQDIFAYESVVVKVYSGADLMTSLSWREEYIEKETMLDFLTCSFRTYDESTQWAATAWQPLDTVVPTKLELYIDDVLMDTMEMDLDPAVWADLLGTVKPVALVESTGVYYETLQEALDVVKDAVYAGTTVEETVTLLANTTETVVVKWKLATSGTTITIDLNGYTITGAGNGPVLTWQRADSGSKVLNGIITDSSEAKTGTITGGNASKGGAVYVHNGKNADTFTVNGGNFVGNTASVSGGAINTSSSKALTLTINGGVFSGNTAKSGGAIYANVLIVNGGEFHDNISVGGTSVKAGGGGAINVTYSEPVLEINGGKIYNNTSDLMGDDIVFINTKGPDFSNLKLADASVICDGANDWYVDGFDGIYNTKTEFVPRYGEVCVRYDGIEYTGTSGYAIALKAAEGYKIVRISGNSRSETGFKAADELKEVLGVEKFDSIILASGDNFADALAGSYLAAVKGAPVLLYRSSALEENAAYIRENLASGGTVYILGGTAAVSQEMEDALAGCNVERLYGSTRFDTNLAILAEAGVTGGEILVATGWNYADSLSASATGKPMLLVNNTTGKLTDTQIEYLSKLTDAKFTIIGGTAAVSEELETALKAYGEVERVYGSTREETSVKVAERYFTDPDQVVVAYSRNFPDGLCAGPLAYAMGAPLLLTNAGAEEAAAAYVKDNGVIKGLVVGGTASVSDETVRTIFRMTEADEIIVK